MENMSFGHEVKKAEKPFAGVYEHFKSVEGDRKYYLVTDYEITDRGEVLIYYQCMYEREGDKPIPPRTLSDFNQPVLWSDGVIRSRFRYVGRSPGY